MNFTYELEGTGWAVGKLEIENQKLDFTVSYLSHPLADLLEALVDMIPTNSKTGESYWFIWKGEPWGYDWKITNVSSNEIRIEIRDIDDVFEKYKEGTGNVIFDVTCSLLDFAKVVTNEAIKLLNKHGFAGYSRTFGGSGGDVDFPITSLVTLKYYSDKKQGVEYQFIPPTNNQDDKLNWVLTTNINDELKSLGLK